MDDYSIHVPDFCAFTGASDAEARHFLEASRGDLQTAVDAYYASRGSNDAVDAQTQSSDFGTSQPVPQAGPTSASSSSAPASSSAPQKNQPPQKKKFGSLRDLQQSDSTEGDDDDDKDQQYFAGGDKSGLAVQDPSGNNNPAMSANEHIQRLLHTARQNRPRPPGRGGDEDADEEEERPRQNNFRGAGVTLGGEGTESHVIPDPEAPPPGRQDLRSRPQPGHMVERTLHLWDDGFSVDDGDLYRYDDPRNAHTLELINRGSAPLDLMNVENGQGVDVKLDHHNGQKYVRPKKKYRPFEGQGTRLGSPTPGAPTSSSVATVFSAAAGTASSAGTSANADVKPTVDESQPTVRLQIRLADGTRLPAQFNTTATIGDVQQFVRNAHGESSTRPFTLATTFPTKEMTDQTAVIGNVSELRRGGNLVQKWI